ncbi:MAG: hypothetical protein MAG795_00531 [Candidatus Woesearchaeota archaeon]|nr:hypothetical protein [Candidatus Woesearchaeota archaeon]
MKCGLCGMKFTEADGKKACEGCYIKNCGLIKCPRCSFENPLSKKLNRSPKKGILNPLTKLRVGDKAMIKCLSTNDSKKYTKLLALGILPGKRIELIHAKPSYAFQVNNSQFVVDKHLAECILVKKCRKTI